MTTMPLLAAVSSAAAGAGMNTWILGGVIVFYLALIGYLGYRGYRRTRTSQDYLLAGRSVHPFVMAMSYEPPSSAPPR